MKELDAREIHEEFIRQFSIDPLIVRSPGRINLIGEHTDYNDGFVMPAAIDKDILFAIAPSGNNQSLVYSLKYKEYVALDITNPKPVQSPMWANYLLGVLKKLKDDGHVIKHFNGVFGGDIPLGAGLSSSAAMECGFAYAISKLNDLEIPKMELILTAQWAEHNFAGVKCGIMDQFASMMGAEGKVVMLDCRSLEYKYFPLELDDHTIVLCNTNVKHALVDSEYNTRRRECEEGVAVFHSVDPSIKSLRDVTPQFVLDHKDKLKGKVFDRCFFMTQEIVRVQKASEDLQRGDLVSFGKKMYEAHEGLSKLYEVSCAELDFLVDQARRHNVTGSRMMGGGFGGCTINIIRNEDVEYFISAAGAAYTKQFGKTMDVYRVQIKNGTSEVESVKDIVR
jgi:galactokinase